MVLRTRYAGDVTMPRKFISAATPLARPDILYEGPGDKTDWVFGHRGEESWTFAENGVSFSGNHGIAGLLLPELPQRFALEVDLAWQGDLNFQMGIMALDPSNPHNGSWTLMLQREYVRLYRYGGQKQGELGNTQIAEFAKNRKASLTLLVDKPEKRITFLFNGESVYEWMDPAGFRPSGDGFFLMGQQNSRVRISRIELRSWDGKQPISEETNPEKDVMRLRNGDRISGRIMEIKDQHIRFEGEFSVFDVPIERLEGLEFASAFQAEAPAMVNPVEVILQNGDHFRLELEGYDREFLKGESLLFGSVQTAGAFLKWLECNFGDARREGLASEEGAGKF